MMESLVQGKLACRVRRGGCGNVRSERNATRRVLTQSDPESRIMKNPTDAAFEQDYNAQVAVDQGSLLIARPTGRYHTLQICTLQRGMRKIRAHLLETIEEQWQAEVIHGQSPAPVEPTEDTSSISSTTRPE